MKESAASEHLGQERRDPLARFLFLAVVAGLYFISFLIAPEETKGAIFFGLKVLAKLWPVLIFVFCLMFIVNLVVRPSWIRRHVGRDSGSKGVWVAMVSGIISMGPVYMWYAMLSDFQKKGMRPALVAVFLYSRGVKIPLLPLMVFYFGITYTVVLTLYMLIFAVLSGFCTEWLAHDRTSV